MQTDAIMWYFVRQLLGEEWPSVVTCRMQEGPSSNPGGGGGSGTKRIGKYLSRLGLSLSVYLMFNYAFAVLMIVKLRRCW